MYGWGTYGLNGSGSYDKVSCCFIWKYAQKDAGLQGSTLSFDGINYSASLLVAMRVKLHACDVHLMEGSWLVASSCESKVTCM